jgi:hypothetical protein
MARYKWDSALEWLTERLDQRARQNDVAELLECAKLLAEQVDSDTIQDLYQPDMNADGFFRDLDITQNLTGKQCIDLLIEAGEDEEALVDGDMDVEQMRQRVQRYIEDETLAYSDVEALAK